MRVTHVVFDFNGGGMETLVADMAARFRGTDFRVSLITLSGRTGRLGEATRDRFDQFHVLAPQGIRSLLRPAALARTIRQTGADVVHVHSGSWLEGARAARMAGVARVVLTEHGREHFDTRKARFLDRYASRSADRVVAVSARLEQYLVEQVGIQRSKLITIANGVDTAKFAPGPPSASLRASLGLPATGLTVGSIGRLEEVKAYHRILEAVFLLKDRLPPDFRVVIFGDGAERERLQRMTEQFQISHLVRFPGWTDHVVDAYRLLDVFVLPSLSEGLSVSLMEAMACGVAPVVSDVGGNPEVLGPTLTEQVLSSAPAGHELADAIWRTIVPDKLAGVGEAARRRATEHYSLDLMMNNYERLYRSLT